MDTENLRASTTAAARRRSAGSDDCVRRAAAYAMEALERRVLLSAAAGQGGASDFLQRLQAHALTPAELEARSWASMLWQGVRGYVKENEWILDLDIGPRGDASRIVRGLGIGASVKQTLGRNDLALVEVPDGVGHGKLTAALAAKGVRADVEPNGIVWAQATPNDPRFPEQYSLHNTGQTVNNQVGIADADIDAPAAWDILQGSSSVVVAVVDTGVEYTHPDLAANMWANPSETANGLDDDGNGIVDDIRGADFVNNDGDPMDDHGHGTHVAGTIGAVGNNGTGVAGVNWYVKLMAVKILGADGSGTFAQTAAGLNYVSDMRARGVNVKITNNSYGSNYSSSTIESAIQTLGNQGVLFVAAAGNWEYLNNDEVGFYPASFVQPNVVSVAATDNRDELAVFSHYGVTSVHLAAPGVDILSTASSSGELFDPSGYRLLSGTSMAAPHVAGVAALALTFNSGNDAAILKGALLQGAERLPNLHGITQTGARLHARGSLDLARAPQTLNGTSGNDTISVHSTPFTPGYVDFTLNGVVQRTVHMSQVSWVRLFGMDGDDTITVSIGAPVWAEGGNGNDNITGSNYGDFLYGNDGNDTLNGNGGNDRLDGGAGADTHRGDAGDDDLAGGTGNDTYLFGYGTLGTDAITTELANADVDTVSFSGRGSAVYADMSLTGTRAGGTGALVSQPGLVLWVADNGNDNANEIENLIGTSLADTLFGNTRNNTLTGNLGNDTLWAGSGPEGADTYSGGGGIDWVTYQGRLNNLELSLDGSANDGEAGELDNISGDVENVCGGWGTDFITGNGLNNLLRGLGGNDTLLGNAGFDVLVGDHGTDVIWGGADVDTVDYSGAAGGIDVSLDGAFNDIDGDGGTDYVATDVENVTGSEAADRIRGSGVANTFMGRGGNDTIHGGAGNDEAYGGDGNDLLWGDADFDRLHGEAGDDEAYGGDGDDQLFGGAGLDRLHGEGGNDLFYARNSDADTLWGGAGTDNADDRDAIDVLWDIP